MKHRLKGLLALVLSLVMVFALATNAWATVWIGSNSLSDNGAFVSDGADGTATLNISTENGVEVYTLTLNNFTFEDTLQSSAISSNQDLTLNLIGENKVTASYTGSGGAVAVSVTGNLTIKGDNGSSLTVSGTYSITDGIHADNVTIESGTVTATGGEAGISANNNVVITGGTVTATGVKYGIYANSVTITGGSVTATATGNDGWGIYGDSEVIIKDGAKVKANANDNGGFGIATKYSTPAGSLSSANTIVISGEGTEVEAGCATGLSASTVNILENSTVNITTNATAPAVGKVIDATTLNFGGNWYQWSTNNPGETTPISSATKAFALNNYGGTGQNPVPTSFTIEKISTGGPATPQPPTYYPIYIPTVEDEPEVTAPNTFDGGIASAVVVTILSATGGAWLAKKKD